MTKLIWITIKERKWSVIIYSAASILLLFLYVALYPSLQSQSAQLSVVMKTLPANLLKALGTAPSQLSNFTLEALLASKQFSAVFQFLAAILAISIAGSDIAGEIEKGTIEFLLSQPISRLKLYFSRFLAGVILLTIFVAASTLAVIPLAAAFHVAYVASAYCKLFLMAWLFTIAFYAIAYCLSAIFSSKGRVSGISAGIVTVMYLIFIIAALKDSLDKLKYFSFFHYFAPDILTSGTIDKLGVWIFIATIIVFVSIGAMVFNRRDIAVN
jgi:ABC-2 type transport system permease protein